METEQLEKQLSIWSKLMYMGLGSAITLLLASPGDFSFTGVVWIVIQTAVTLAGFFLLLGRRWKALPLSKERINTTFGYLFASWLSLCVPLTMGGGDDTYNFVLLAYSLFLVLLYWRFRRKHLAPEDMFP